MSVDEELAHATSHCLSMGSSIVTDLSSASCVLPRKLHHALYSNSLGDADMTSQLCSGGGSDGGGVPGFPDFPDFWQGETSADRITARDACMGKKHNKKWKANAAGKRRQRRLVRKAVNVSGTSNAVGTGKELKRRLKGERLLRRNEKVKKLQERRRRKREMGSICQGLASMKCK